MSNLNWRKNSGSIKENGIHLLIQEGVEHELKDE